MELLNIQQIEKYYGNKSSLTKAIDDISFSVAQGEFLAIMGASGSGKTTLLNCISTIDRVTAGHIYLENTDITTLKGKALNKFRREKLGFIFQDFNLLDTLTAYENISLALSIQKRSASEIDTAVKTVAQQLGITEVLQKYPYQMSGGQKQRVASARAIVTNPNLSLLNFNIVNASHYVLIPAQPASFDLDGLAVVLQFVEGIKPYNPTLQVGGIIINRYDARNRLITEAAMDQLRESYSELLFEQIIRVDSRLQNAQWENRPVLDYAGSARISKEYRALTKEILKRCV